MFWERVNILISTEITQTQKHRFTTARLSAYIHHDTLQQQAAVLVPEYRFFESSCASVHVYENIGYAYEFGSYEFARE